MANNDELRDAFCARRSMKLTQDTEAVNIILKRPFAQINVGMTKTAWDAVVRNYKNIKTSSIELSGICDTYNLLDDNMVYDEQALVEVEFAAATIPSDTSYMYHTSKYLKVDLDRNGKINGYENENPEEFIWVSMCYVLVPGYTSSDTQDSDSAIEYSTLVDLKQLILGYDGYTDEDTKLGFEASTFELGEVPNLPTLRNHRTNLILDSWPIDTKAITIEICPEYNGDTKHEGSDNTDTPNDGHNALSPR